MLREDEILLNEFRKTLQRNARKTVVDLDSSFIHKFDFQVYRFEDIMRGTNRSIPPNRWSYHRIGLIKKGSGEFITGIYQYKATKNTLVVIPARVITSSKNWTLDMEGYIGLFNIDFFLQINFPHQHIENKKILMGCAQPFIQLSDEHAAEIAAIFETMLEENRADRPGKNELIALKVIELLIHSERLFDEQLNFEANLPLVDIVKTFSDLVEANFIQERTVSFYADRLHVHPNYLNSLIKKQTGRTAKESIQNRLLLEIKYLLHSTNLTIKEIASQLGFNDANYFSSFFTRLENLSPKKYRSSFI
jgi:AraC family transcriptional activator of pobA